MRKKSNQVQADEMFDKWFQSWYRPKMDPAKWWDVAMSKLKKVVSKSKNNDESEGK